MTAALDPATVTITLTVEVGADPVRGAIVAPSGQVDHFQGWLQLSEAIDGLRHPECRSH